MVLAGRLNIVASVSGGGGTYICHYSKKKKKMVKNDGLVEETKNAKTISAKSAAVSGLVIWWSHSALRTF